MPGMLYSLASSQISKFEPADLITETQLYSSEKQCDVLSVAYFKSLGRFIVYTSTGHQNKYFLLYDNN
jgi:hypothetical protein